MIHNLTIRNYQSIAEAELPLGLFTVIVGDSNVGKSAVIRAFHAFTKIPRGDDYVRDDETVCHLSLDTEEHVFGFTRQGKDSFLIIDDQVFEKLGGITPEYFLDALRLGPVAGLDGTQIALHVQKQFDPLFILAESSRSRASLFSSLTGVGLLLEGIKAVGRDISTNNKVLKIKTAELAEKENILSAILEVVSVEEIETECEQILYVEGLLSGLSSARIKLESLLTKLETNTQFIEATQTLPETEAIDLLIDHLSTLHTLRSLVDKEQTIQDRLVVLEDLNDAKSLLDKTSDLLQDLKSYAELKKAMEKQDDLVNQIKEAEQTTEVFQKELDSLHAEYRVTHDGEICELCGRMITNDE